MTDAEWQRWQEWREERWKVFDLELAPTHRLKFFCWRPDRELNPQCKEIADIERAGASIMHRRPDGTLCEAAIHFDTPEVRRIFTNANSLWQVLSWEPLTVSPSLLCCAELPSGEKCGDHGFIREGRWVVA